MHFGEQNVNPQFLLCNKKAHFSALEDMRSEAGEEAWRRSGCGWYLQLEAVALGLPCTGHTHRGVQPRQAAWGGRVIRGVKGERAS